MSSGADLEVGGAEYNKLCSGPLCCLLRFTTGGETLRFAVFRGLHTVAGHYFMEICLITNIPAGSGIEISLAGPFLHFILNFTWVTEPRLLTDFPQGWGYVLSRCVNDLKIFQEPSALVTSILRLGPAGRQDWVRTESSVWTSSTTAPTPSLSSPGDMTSTENKSIFLK